jgi:predicted nucleotidyltransferase component of viral defense system
MPKNKPLAGKGLLSPIQRSFLSLFSQVPDNPQFYLTGGTALSEFYLGHRLSYDLDLFTGIDGLVLPVSYQIESLGSKNDLEISTVRRFATYVEFLVKAENASLKVDLALDSPFRFEDPLTSEYGVRVNNYQDLRIDKLLAYYGRAEPRDAIDLFFIMKTEPIEMLMKQAAQKDPGFDRYWFSVALNRSASFPDDPELWPVKMLVPFEPVILKSDFNRLALSIIDSLEK